MVEITRFAAPSQGSGTQISVGGAAQTQISASNQIAGTISKVAEAVQASGDKYMEEASLSIAGTEFNKALSTATVAMTEAKQKRYQKTTDKDGNPSYGTLINDMTKIGNEVMTEASKGIISLDALSAFKTKFSNHMTNEIVLAGEEARKQQVDFARASLNEGLNVIAERAISDDPSNVGVHEQSALEMLNTQLQGGAITAQEYQKKRQEFSQDVRVGQFRNKIDSNASMTLEQFERTDAGTVGLTNSNFLQLKREAQAKVRAEANASKAAAKAGEEEALQKGMTVALLSDNNMGEYTTKEINKHYKTTVQQLEGASGQKLSMFQKLELTKEYGVPVPAAVREAEWSIKSGSLDEGGETVLALNQYLEDPTNTEAFSGLDDDSQSILALSRVQTRLGVATPAEALRDARESVLTADDPVKAERALQYKSESDLNPKYNTQLIEDIFGLDRFDFGTGLRDIAVSESAAATMKPLIRDAYIQTGSVEGAKAYMQQKYGKMFGTSQFNDEQFMLYPPENTVPNGNFEALQQNMWLDMLPSIPEGVDLDDLQIESDFTTLLDPDNPSYSVFYVDDNGITQPVIDESGEKARWTPNVDFVRKESERQDNIDKSVRMAEAQALREANQTGNDLEFGSITKVGGVDVVQAVRNFAIKTFTGLGEWIDQGVAETKLKNLQSNEINLQKARQDGDIDSVKILTKNKAMLLNEGVQSDAYTDRTNLGNITSKFESSGNPAAINMSGPDGANGGSYGSYQLNGGTLTKFLEGSEQRQEFVGLKRGSLEFRAKWVSLAHNPNFQQEQKDFIIEGSFKPARRNADKRNIPVGAGTDEAIYSLSVQLSPKSYKKVMDAAAKEDPQNELEWVESLYRARGNLLPKFRSRYKRELNQVRGLIR